MAESGIVKEILATLRAAGWWAEKTHGDSFTTTGSPDIHACIAGRFVALEVKRPGAQATKAQLYHLRMIREAGGVGAVVDDADVVRDALARWPRICDACLRDPGTSLNEGPGRWLCKECNDDDLLRDRRRTSGDPIVTG